MRCQPVTLSGYAEAPKVADAVIEAGQKPYEIFRRCAWILRELQTHSCHGHTGMIVATHLPYLFLRSLVEPHHAKSWVLFAWRCSQASLMPNFTGLLLTSDSEMMQYTPQPS
jgi:hypothetical protein